MTMKFVNIHTHKSSKINNNLVEVYNAKFHQTNKNIRPVSVGLHPWDIDPFYLTGQLNELEIWLNENKPDALGEIGLDRVIKIDYELQKTALMAQLKLSERYQLPVILHCVRAWFDILEIQKKESFLQPSIFHGFNGSVQTANQIIKTGGYVSFGPLLLKSEKNQQVFIKTPLTHCFLETDDTEFDIITIYKFAANLKEISVDELKKQLYVNFQKIFQNA